MTLSDLLVPTYVQMLGALSQWLAKAEGERPAGEVDALMAARLTPDMFPLATQVRFACRQALEGVSRLAERDLPPLSQNLLDEGRSAGEQPGTLAAAQGRIAETISAIESIAGAIDAIEPDAAIAHALPNGMILDFTAEQYARDWALPQFYFHVGTAYSILRAQGVTLGKADYAAHMLSYLRAPATA